MQNILCYGLLASLASAATIRHQYPARQVDVPDDLPSDWLDLKLPNGMLDARQKGKEAGESGDDGSDWPQELKDNICKQKFDYEEEWEVSNAWYSSGAGTWFEEWIKKNGGDNWTDKFFKSVIAGGKQGGSTFDCKSLGSTTCTGHGTTPCTTYTLPMAFYVHVQIANMFSAFHKIWVDSINFSIQQLSGDIKDIVEEYGDPPKDDRGTILNMLVGILTAGAGIGAASSEIAGGLTFFAGAIASASANSDSFSQKVTPEDLNDDLENAYGKAFTAVLNTTTGYVENVLSGRLPDNKQDQDLTDWVLAQFSQGQWLSEPMVTKAIDTYIEGTHKKWVCGRNPPTECFKCSILS